MFLLLSQLFTLTSVWKLFILFSLCMVSPHITRFHLHLCSFWFDIQMWVGTLSECKIKMESSLKVKRERSWSSPGAWLQCTVVGHEYCPSCRQMDKSHVTSSKHASFKVVLSSAQTLSDRHRIVALISEIVWLKKSTKASSSLDFLIGMHGALKICCILRVRRNLYKAKMGQICVWRGPAVG